MNCNFSFFSYNIDHSVSVGDELWNLSLPSNPAQGISFEDTITYGEYFVSVKKILKRNNFEIIKHIHSIINPGIYINDLIEIRIIISKHGEFYHPSKLEMVYSDKTYPLVINLAISQAGRERIETEFGVLKELNVNLPYNCIPNVYYFSDFKISHNKKLFLFIGDWFENYHEFHVSSDNEGNRKTIVWDEIKGNFYLSQNEEINVYEKAATILTLLYNTETYEQVFPWHHAAGDFILKRDNNNNIDLKLITIRQYSSMIENVDYDPEFDLLALMVFFVNMSVRMRLDRLDGTGNTVWLDDFVARAVVKGFREGLFIKKKNHLISGSMIDDFINFINNYEEKDLMDIGMHIVESYNQNASEILEIKKNLRDHIHLVHNLLVTQN